MINVSLVAFYGKKSPQLTALIGELQTYLAELKLVDAQFIAYQLEQVHGTILGCKGLKTELGIINYWFYERRQGTKYVNLSGFIDYVQTSDTLPLMIRFGGYNPHVDYDFLSRDRHPFIRSFQLQKSAENTFIPILIGWSFKDNLITHNIDKLRRDAQQFNLLHKYHFTTDAIDNDFYLRLGTITGKLAPEKIEVIENDLRHLLLTKSPTYIALDRDNLALVKYQDLSLTPATTEVLPVSTATADNSWAVFF